MERHRTVRLAQTALAVAVTAGLAVSGCATRRDVAAEIQRAESRFDARLAELAGRLEQYEGALRGQEDRLGVLETDRGQAGGRVEAMERRASAATTQADEAVRRADQADATAAEARRLAGGAVATAGRSADRLAAIEARLDRLSGRQADTVVATAVVRFAFDRWNLDAGAETVLGDVLKRLEREPTLLVTLEGFADSQGPDGYNFELSRKRAEAVRRFLVDGGVGLRRLEHIGYGEMRPAADNATAGGRATNRRVVIKLLAGE